MHIPGTGRLGAMARRAGNRFSPRPLILAYHRVTTLPRDPQRLAVTPGHFREQLEVLRDHAKVIALGELLQRMPTGRWPRRAVVITFDDGYADNLLEAMPELATLEMPATFFLAAGIIGREEEFFWDELERIFLQPGTLPRELTLEAGQRVHQWELSPLERYFPAQAEKHAGWIVEAPGPTVRQAVYRTLCDFLRPLPPTVQRAQMERIRQWAKVERTARPTHRAMSRQEAVELADSPGVEIGAHSVRHPVLAKLPREIQQSEIVQCKALLEALINRPARSFSYPYGSSDSFTDQTAALVTEAGFVCGLTTLAAAVEAGGDPMRLPRVIARDWDGAEFRRQLDRWFIDG